MRIEQTNITINTAGYVDRMERGFPVKRENVHYWHVMEPILIPRPEIQNYNSLVVVHDQMEQYI